MTEIASINNPGTIAKKINYRYLNMSLLLLFIELKTEVDTQMKIKKSEEKKFEKFENFY